MTGTRSLAGGFKVGVFNFYSTYTSQVFTVLAIVILGAILTILTDGVFIDPENLVSVLVQSTLVSILAVAETLIIITGGIDLSVGAVVALSSAFMGELVVNGGIDPFLGIGIALAIGLFAGLFHGLLITKINIPPFIVTLGTMTLWRGIALEFTKGQNVYALPPELTWIGQGSIGIIPASIVLTLAIYFLAWFMLNRTKLGLHTYAIGGNQQAARLSGVNIDRTKIVIYTIGGVLCAIAGILISGRMNATSGSVCSGYELDAIAAVVIGGTSLAGGQGIIWGSLLGAILMQIIRNGLNLMSVSPYYQMVVLGAVIVLAVGIDCFRRRKK